jgi:hypothetical protein
MLTYFLIGLAVLVAAGLGLFVVAVARLPRMHHWTFAHQLLPTQLFADPTSVLDLLISPTGASEEGRRFLLQLWDQAGTGVPPDGLAYSTEVLGHPNSTAFYIELPAPVKKPEAYFAAIVFDGPGLAAGNLRSLRYFVLEFHGFRDGSPKTLLGEWQDKGQGSLAYADHGAGTAPTKDAFLARVQEIVERP